MVDNKVSLSEDDGLYSSDLCQCCLTKPSGGRKCFLEALSTVNDLEHGVVKNGEIAINFFWEESLSENLRR